MKKVSIWVSAAVIILSALAGPGRSRENGAKTAKLTAGIKGGFAMAGCGGLDKPYDPRQWVFLIPDVEKGFRFGTESGVFFDYKITTHLSVRPEVLYAQEGCKRTVNIEVNQVLGTVEAEYRGKMEATAKLDYLEIPVLLRVSFKNDALVSPFVLAGPSVGFKMSANMPYDVEYNYREFMRGGGPTLFSADTSWTREYDLDDLVKATRFSLVLGAGCDVALGPGVVTGELRYSQGLADVLENTGRIEVAPGEYLYFEKLKGYSLSFSVAYSIPLWK